MRAIALRFWGVFFTLFTIMTIPALAETKKPYILDGFRSAKFGMTVKQVEQAVVKDFEVPSTALKPIKGKEDTFGVQLDKLAPFASPARLEYYFDRGSKTLNQILVEVIEDDNSEVVQEVFVRKVLAISQYINGKDLSAFDVLSPSIYNEEVLIMGLIAKNPDKRSAFEMVLQNIEADIEGVNMSLQRIKDPKKPIGLRLNYVKHMPSDEKIKIKEGDF